MRNYEKLWGVMRRDAKRVMRYLLRKHVRSHGFSIYLALPLEHCLSSVAASLREAA